MAGKRAVIWAAVSTKPQADEDEKFSIPQQIENGKRFAESQGLAVVDVLVVPGHSRSYRSLDKLAEDARQQGIDAFDRLIAHLERCDFDAVIVRDANRFARKPSLLHFIAESIVEDCGASIYDMANGVWVNEQNVDMWATMQGWKTSAEVKWLREALKAGLNGRAERGLSTTRPPWSHVLVYDESGIRPKVTGLAIDESKRRLFNDLYTLVVEERCPFKTVEVELFTRFGHATKAGKPYPETSMYQFLTRPLTWGATGYRFSARFSRGVDRAWTYDPSVPPPDGVTLHWGALPAIYEGEQGERMRSELRRRALMSGNRRPTSTRMFSGLLVCDACGRTLSARTSRVLDADGRRKAYAYGCNALGPIRDTPKCPQSSAPASVGYLREYLDGFLRVLITTGDLASLTPAVRDVAAELATVQAELTTLEAALDGLIASQAAAHPATQGRYQARIDAMGEQLAALQRRASALEGMSRRQDRALAGSRAGVAKIEAVFDRFWELPEVEINQLLHLLMGESRFVVRDRQIVGVQPGR